MGHSLAMRLQPRSLRLAVAVAATLQGVSASCLPEAIAPEARVSINDGESETALGIWLGDWASGWVTSQVALTLVQEVLGVMASFSGVGGASYMSLYATAGCTDPVNYLEEPGCSASPRYVHHVAMELWGAGKHQLVSERLADMPEVIPELGSSMGYEGIEGIYIKDAQLSAAWNDGGVPLEYYKAFNVDHYTPSRYFQSWNEVPPSEMLFCNETMMMLATEMAKYVEVTGDLGGVVVDPASNEIISGKCWHDSWWFSPACRDQPETCVPYLTAGGGWGVAETMQQAAYHNMPFAVGVAATYGLWVANARQYATSAYWWQPDASMIDFHPKKMVLPPHNAAEHAQGVKVTGRTGLPLLKSYYNRLWVVAPRVHDFLQRITLTLSDVDEMILAKVANESRTYEDVVCDWLLDHEGVWRAWIPIETKCVAGAGIVDEHGAYVSARPSAVTCSWCREGFYSEPVTDDVGATFVCRGCGAGTSQASPGQTECLACEPGTFSDANESRTCARCPIGTYQPNASSTACTPCPAPMVTFFQEATSLLDCSCPAGSYKPVNGSRCEGCPGGMTCAANSSEAAIPEPGQKSHHPFPMAAEGYMTRPGAPLDAYKCQHVLKCPGGPPGTCALNRDSRHIACSRCEPGTYAADDHECRPCEGGESAAIIVIGILFCLIFLAMLTFAINKDMIAQPHAITTCVLVCALVFMGIQTMGVFNALDVTWVEPLKSIMAGMNLLTFDLDVIKMDCMVGSGPVTKYVFRQLVAPVGVVIIALILVVKKQLTKMSWHRYSVELVNTAGAVFQVFFISIAISAWTPFVCYEHPGELGRSMVSSPSILCFDDDSHSAMAAVGMLACVLVLLPFIVLVLCATWKHAQFVIDAQMNKGSGLLMYRFLFYRFTPACYFYGSVLLVRNLSLCLVPVVIQWQAVQLCVMTFILQSTGVLQLLLCPWRSNVANWADGVLTSALVMLLLCVAMSSDFASVAVLIGNLGTVVLVSALLMLLGIISHSIFQYFNPKPWYHKFICHHKADAAAQARFLQVCLQLQGYQVFIDSDNLTNLDDLFDIVRSRVGQLVVYLTGSTLRRPWCAGEITVSYCSHQSVACVVMPSFQPPTDADLGDLGSYIDMGSTNLGSYGIKVDTIAVAFQWLLGDSVPSVVVSQELIGRSRYDFMVAGLLGSKAASPRPPSPMQPGAVVIVSDPADDEATAAAGILCNKILTPVLSFAKAGVWMLADSKELAEEEIVQCIEDAHCVIVVLSKGSMESTTQLSAIDAAMQRMERADENAASQGEGNASNRVCKLRSKDSGGGAFQVIPVNIPDFRFPDEAYWSTSFPRLMPRSKSTDIERARGIFKRICVYFATNSSDQVIEAQAKDVLQRIPTVVSQMTGRTSNSRLPTGNSTEAPRTDRPDSGSSQPPPEPEGDEEDQELVPWRVDSEVPLSTCERQGTARRMSAKGPQGVSCCREIGDGVHDF